MMAIDNDQAFKIELAIEGAKESPLSLSEWESGFIFSISEKYEMYGRDALISEKQWKYIDAVYDKVVPTA